MVYGRRHLLLTITRTDSHSCLVLIGELGNDDNKLVRVHNM